MPNQSRQNRRQFLKSAAITGSAAMAATVTPYWLTTSPLRAQDAPKTDRHTIGCIGTGDRWNGAIGPQVKHFGDIVAVCDVDRDHLEKWGQKVAGGKADMYDDYRRVLDRNAIDVVTIVVPDHWHSKIAIEAMQAGKDVYCEKPLTLTIDEGKKICQVQKQTGRVFQVGTQQRSEFGVSPQNSGTKENPGKGFRYQFLQAVALAQSGKLGKIKKVTCSIGSGPSCGPLPKVDVPSNLNFERWLGQAPLVEFVQGEKSASSNRSYPAGRTHYEFRWWYEYSGGKLTDWGAHHVDIATWAIGMDHSGPTSVEATATLPVPFENGNPTVSDRYNTATKFNIKFLYPNGVEMIVREGPDNGIWIQGEDAEIFVNRDRLKDITGTVVANLAETPVPEEDLVKLCKGKKPGNHMGNFIECVRDRSLPISDVHTHHRALTTCHLANIAIRTGRPLKWDPEKEEIVGDAAANAMLSREQRKGYEVKV